jgi:hypothetical protein
MSKRKSKVKNWFNSNKVNIFLAILLFSISFFIRFQYQKIDEVPTLRGDQQKYITIANNFHNYRVYSVDSSYPPQYGSEIRPGYPLYLSTFFDGTKVDFQEIFTNQAVLGSLTVLFTFLTALLFLSRKAAFIVGILVAINPHLIALEGLLLTENTFIPLLSAGVFFICYGQVKNNHFSTLIGGLSLAIATYTRVVNIFMIPLFIAIFIYEFWKSPKKDKKNRIKMKKSIITLIFAWCTIYMGNQIIVLTNTPPVEVVAVEESEQTYNSIPGYLLSVLDYSLIPPIFFVEKKPGILSTATTSKEARYLKRESELSFFEAPWIYIRWISYGKLRTLWSFKQGYSGSVHINAPLTDPFETNQFYKITHNTMKVLHWPLFILSLLGIAIYCYQILTSKLAIKQSKLKYIIVGFTFTLLGLVFVGWLPRYSIPLRPLSYIIAIYASTEIYKHVKKRFQG